MVAARWRQFWVLSDEVYVQAASNTSGGLPRGASGSGGLPRQQVIDNMVDMDACEPGSGLAVVTPQGSGSLPPEQELRLPACLRARAVQANARLSPASPPGGV